MVTDHISSRHHFWRVSTNTWGLLLIAILIVVAIYYDGLSELVRMWSETEEYSHGFLIPLITLFLIWQKSDQLREFEFAGSWFGFAIVVCALLLNFVGNLSALFIIVQYSFLLTIVGAVLSFTGWNGLKKIWVPLLYLVFMIPLPNFFYNTLSLKLQLISSRLGVDFIRLCDISVYLEGNVIDLGAYKLQVVEACNGLRYLFPFMSLAFLCAYIFDGAFWKKAVIFLSSIPISIVMNSFRIGIIGVLVEYLGTGAAEGFLHDFEGWAVFMVCMGILFLEMWILTKIGHQQRSLAAAFNIRFPDPLPNQAVAKLRSIPASAIAVLVTLFIGAALSFGIEKPEEKVPSRKQFVNFPLQMDQWQATTEKLARNVAEVLQLDDYILADYRDGSGNAINVYVAYYESQSKGHSIHSPRSCLPGGGWQINELPRRTMAVGGGKTDNIARVLIEKGEAKQLVYFWTQQRGRIINNEYAIKWYLFWDALSMHRSDGALVRFVTPLTVSESIDDADRRLNQFVNKLLPMLPDYIPN